MPWLCFIAAMKISPYQRKKVKVKAIVSLICGEVWSVTDCYCAHQAMQTHSFIKNAVSQKQQILTLWGWINLAASVEGIIR